MCFELVSILYPLTECQLIVPMERSFLVGLYYGCFVDKNESL
ncbi:hypothetical protein 16Q_160c [Pseudomonas phage 16Q]|nr:hypothetical protein 16Q_160c [Pseudomonas phage 16Q]